MILPKSKATLVRALHRRKGRREHDAFLVEGERALDEIARTDASVHFAFAREEHFDALHAYFPSSPLYTIARGSDALFATDNPQGLGAVVAIPKSPLLQDLISASGPLLVLDAVADPGNVGTILRSAAWFGVDGVVLLPGCADAFGPKAVRASMGAIMHVPIVDAGVDELFACGRTLYALDADAEQVLGSNALPRNAFYIVGNEAHGVSPDVAARSIGLAIRGRGNIESLNAATAASILCYELSRIDE